MDWFRFYHAALDDPKVQLLEPVLFKAWVNLLCLASQSKPRGVLPEIDDIAFRLRKPIDEVSGICVELVARSLLEPYQGGMAIHNWGGRQRQSDDSTPRVTKHRKSKKQDVTLHETDVKREGNALEQNRTDTDTEQTTPLPPTGKAPNGAPVGDYRSRLGDDYWSALKEFKKLDPVLGNGWLEKALNKAPPGLSGDAVWRSLENALNRIGDDFQRDETEHFIKSRYGWASRILEEEFTDMKAVAEA